jgi:DMSO reductase anchor subunit
MNPAISVIVFTTASGMGYGMLVLLAVFAVGGLLPQNQWFGILAFGFAFGTITFGLLVSAYHLGRPERIWLSFSQWRSSWLSRQAILAVAVYVPGLLFAFGMVVLGTYKAPWGMLGMIAAVLSVMTVYCTGMIYATLRPVHAWSNRATVPNYLALALWTGMVWLNFLVHIFGAAHPVIAMVLVVSGFVSFYMKRRSWRQIDTAAHLSDTAAATGLGDLGKIRLLDVPNTQQNFVQHEMVFQIGRKHSEKLRRYAFYGLFAVPLPILMVTMESAPWLAIPSAFLGAVMVTVGVLIERWLFFAEATHTVSLYYGGEEA